MAPFPYPLEYQVFGKKQVTIWLQIHRMRWGAAAFSYEI
jgi:hypothetical protein